MAVYMILDYEIIDEKMFDEYAKQAPATVAQYGGRYHVRGSAITPLPGGWDPQRIVVVEFPSMEGFWTWYESPEYRAILPLREQSTKGQGIVVEGLDGQP